MCKIVFTSYVVVNLIDKFDPMRKNQYFDRCLMLSAPVKQIASDGCKQASLSCSSRHLKHDAALLYPHFIDLVLCFLLVISETRIFIGIQLREVDLVFMGKWCKIIGN